MMKKIKTILIATIAISLMVGCFPQASQVIKSLPVESKSQILAQFSEQQISQGHSLFSTNCDNCHKLKTPENYTAEQWNSIVKRMIPKAKLSDEDGKLVRAYLIAHSKEN